MKKFITILIILFCKSICIAQYWQQQVNYIIDVTLNDKERSLDAFEKLTYINNSPDTISFIWFHLWPNAYKNDRTAFSDQLLENGNTRFYFSEKEDKGYINQLDFKVDGFAAKMEDHPFDIDIIKLLLPKPLLPQQQIVITTPFHVKLPFNFSRSGYDFKSFQITQWYPKPAVFDNKGWHAMPYLDQGEFYSEFGNYTVRITVPKNYVLAATGELQNKEEKEWLRTRAQIKSVQLMHKRFPVSKSPKPYQLKKKKQTKPGSVIQFANQPEQMKTLIYKQDNVHDFAWFADKSFIVNSDTCNIQPMKTVMVYCYYTIEQQDLWKKSLQYAKDAIRFYSNEIGEYPYGVVSVVQGPQSFGGGMEYPTITVISPTKTAEELDETIAHEIGHNWFYGILASNEREHPWMDEGINSFYEYKYMLNKYGKQTQEKEILFQTRALRRKDQPIETSSEKLNVFNYDLVVYHKTAIWMAEIEKKTGVQSFREMMHLYYEQWGFRHPYPEDFKTIVSSKLGRETDSIFSFLNEKGILPGHQLSGFDIISPFKKNSIINYLLKPTKDALFISPAIGANIYDKLMIGGIFTNYKVPPNKFQFMAIPMYATGSKKFAGLIKLNYSYISNTAVRKTDIFLNGSNFSMDQITDNAGNKLVMQYKKLVPGFRLTLREKNPRSSLNRYIQWKTFFFNEQYLHIMQDTVINGTDTTSSLHYLIQDKNRYLNQLQFVFENNRVLYPYTLNLQIEQARDFVRPAFSFQYFFNYAKEGGLQLRFFAGKFIYLNGKTIQKEFSNDRYFLNMTGAKGYEDYTYSDYFIGRNSFEGLSSQQIMIRDGGFKVRTDLLANKIGKTDNWLTAFNFTSTIPQKINPLSVLPVKIPLKVYLDIGTYAEAWQTNMENDHILYDLGLQIPLLDEVINIYIPVLYNKVYSDYFKSTLGKNRFLKTLSFSINLFNKDLKKINQELEF